MKRLFTTASIAAVVLSIGIVSAADSWVQWGGPHKNFNAESADLADKWPDDGPRKLWSRELGDGYSAILVDSGRLYTMYRADDNEIVVALDAKTGEPVWQHAYEDSPREGHVAQFGTGPRSTPLISGDHIYSIGVAGRMHCLNKTTGKVVWSHELWGDDLAGNVLNHGYSSSPIAYKDNVIVLVGGEGSSIVAFNKKTGKVAWKNLDFKNSYSTPRVLNVDGDEQLVTFMAQYLIGIDPDNGQLKWQFAHENQWGQNINMPSLVEGKYMLLSSPEVGAKGIKLTSKSGKTEVEEIWSTRKIQYYHVTTVQNGDYVYGSTGTRAPAFMSAVNVKTGEIAWRERGFAKANVIAADGRLVILDEDGKLYLATATPENLTVHAETELLERVAWTVPTIVGKTMFVRDKTNIMAFDLG